MGSNGLITTEEVERIGVLGTMWATRHDDGWTLYHCPYGVIATGLSRAGAEHAIASGAVIDLG